MFFDVRLCFRNTILFYSERNLRLKSELDKDKSVFRANERGSLLKLLQLIEIMSSLIVHLNSKKFSILAILQSPNNHFCDF